MAGVEALVRSFDNPDETRELARGRFEIVRVGGMTHGRATYEPGWKWSEHVCRPLGLSRCTVEHVGIVLEGAAVAVMDDGRIIDLKAGTLFHVPGEPHDSWVVGDQRYVSLHFLGAEGYAT